MNKYQVRAILRKAKTIDDKIKVCKEMLAAAADEKDKEQWQQLLDVSEYLKENLKPTCIC